MGTWHVPSRRLLTPASAVILAALLAAAAGVEEPAEPAFERLVELNSGSLFGGKARVSGDQVEITYDADGQMAAGFEGKGILDSKSELLQGANRNFIILEKKDNVETLVKGLCAVGMGDGTWTSRFRLAGAPWVSVNVRVPNLIGPQSNLRVRVNWNKGIGYETSFFTNVSYMSGGVARSTEVTKKPEYKGGPTKWFPRKSKTSFVGGGFGLKDGRAVATIDGKETASIAKAFDRGGKIEISFTRLTFTLDSMKISGKLDREWTEGRLGELRKAGTLRIKPPPAAQ